MNTPRNTSNPSRSETLPQQQGKRTKGTSSRKPMKRKLFHHSLYATTRDHRMPRWGNQRGANRMARSQSSRQLCPYNAENTTPDQRHAKLLGGKQNAIEHAPIMAERGIWNFPAQQDMADYSSTRRSTHARNEPSSRLAPSA